MSAILPETKKRCKFCKIHKVWFDKEARQCPLCKTEKINRKEIDKIIAQIKKEDRIARRRRKLAEKVINKK